jgi:hypothetical protein
LKEEKEGRKNNDLKEMDKRKTGKGRERQTKEEVKEEN